MYAGLLMFTVPTLLHLSPMAQNICGWQQTDPPLLLSCGKFQTLPTYAREYSFLRLCQGGICTLVQNFELFVLTDKLLLILCISDITNTVSFHMHDRSRMQKAIA